MSKLNPSILKNKFRGCILGALVGDCYGAPFIGDGLASSSKIVLQKYFDKLDGPIFKAPAKKCTKDSIMTKCIAQTLVEDPTKPAHSKIAKCFVKEYFVDPRRGYPEGTTKIFHKLRANKFQEPFKPAQEEPGQTDNGACGRVSPIALFYHDNYDAMIKAAKLSAQITHTHKQAISGALLQCVTIYQGLLTDPCAKLNNEKFVGEIIDKLKDIEKDEEGLGIGHPTPFTNQMEIVLELLKNPQTEDEAVVDQLGHSMLAVYSVPTAIYCFLRAQSEIENVDTTNPFRRAIQYAITLGGDTATIAGLTGSIAGSYYGEEKLGKSLVYHCENNGLFEKLSEQLFAQKFKL